MARGNQKKGKYRGIYYREHLTRKNGVRKDKYFILRYTVNGKRREEGFGWESEGFTETKAYMSLCEIRENIKNGSGFCSLNEKAILAKDEKLKQEAEVIAENAKNITFGQTWDKIYEPIYLNQKRAKVQQNELIDYKKYIEPLLSKLVLRHIVPADIEQIKGLMKEKAPATVNHVIDVVRQVFNAAKNAGIFSGENPASKVVRLKKDNRRIRFLTKEEAKTLLEELSKCQSPNLHDIAVLGLYCGLRAGEIFALQWIDVDFVNRKISIRDPKGVFNRFAQMNNLVYEMLHKRYINQLSDEYVFTKRGGGKINEVSDQFQRIVNRLGLNENITDQRNKVVFHTLRHTFASWLAMGGIDIFTIKELMGHSDIKMTQRYMHLAPNKFASAIAVLDAPMSPLLPLKEEKNT